MHVRVVHEVGVDLVGDDQEVVTLGDVGEPAQFGLGEHVAGGVVRVAQQQCARMARRGLHLRPDDASLIALAATLNSQNGEPLTARERRSRSRASP